MYGSSFSSATQDAVNKGQTKLDDLIAAGNYREIANRQLELLAAVRGNADQEKKFREALEKVRDADIAIERAAMLQKNGDNFGAWEAVQVALDAWPEDAKLNATLGKYSVKSAEFISLLDRAKTAETKGNEGQSLSLYVNALAKYPGSRFAREGVERLTQIVLAQ